MTSSRIALSLCAGLVGMLPVAAHAAVGQWSPIGPDGGRVITVVHDPVTVTTSYAWTGAGLYKTIDGGDNWTILGPGMFLREPAISAANPSVLYAVGGIFGIATLDGVYKSVDGGATWTRVFATIPYSSGVESLAVDSTNPSIVYAATNNDGLYKTIDGGGTWAHSDTGITDDGYLGGGPSFRHLVIDPLTPTTLFASVYGSVGIYKTTNAGATWAPSNTGLPATTGNGGGHLAIDPQTPSTLYVFRGSLYKSTNGGASWAAPPNAGYPAAPVWTFAIDPATPSVLYVSQGYGASAGLYRSADGADSWSPTGCLGFITQSVAVRTDGGIFVAADNSISFPLQGGVYRSTDGAASCALASHGISAFRVEALAAAGTLYMGDGEVGAYRSTDGGVTWSNAHGGLNGIETIVHDLAVDPATPSTVYQTSGNGLNDRVWKSIDAGDSWTSVRGPFPFYESLAIDPTDPDRVLLGIGGFMIPEPPISSPAAVERTIDGGGTWTRHDIYGVHVGALAVAPSDPSIVYAGNDSQVLRSVDGGATFPFGGIGIPFGQPVIGLAVDSSDPSIAYALAIALHAPNPAGVFKSVDAGATWVPQNVGIEGLYSAAIALDPASPSTLYLATYSDGVFVTTDGAATWSPVNDGLAAPFTRSITVDPTIPGRVYVGTASSSVFVRDFPPPCPPGSDGDPCFDGDICTLNDVCVSGTCQGTVPACGDGVVAGCEACDDGAANGTPASCCTAGCQLVTAGTACTDDGDLCSNDRCDGAGVCTHPTSPDPLCITPTTRGATLKIIDKTGTGTDRVTFKWAKGPAVAKPAFGAPNGATAYALCIYDRTPGGDVMAYRGRPLPPCTTSPCWTDVPTGWKFKSPGGPDGITNVVLKSGVAGRAKLQVKGKGAPLVLGPLPYTKSPSVVAEVRTSDGACWGATFSSALKNTSERFTARSD